MLHLCEGHLWVEVIVFLELLKSLFVELELQENILFVDDVWLRAIEPRIFVNLTVLESVHVVEHDDVLECTREIIRFNPDAAHSALSWFKFLRLLLILTLRVLFLTVVSSRDLYSWLRLALCSHVGFSNVERKSAF